MSDVVPFRQPGQPEAAPPPHNIEAEQAVLGTLLLMNDTSEQMGALEPKHFFDPVHAKVYEMARRRIGLGMVASPVTLKGTLAADAGLAQLGGPDYLARLAGSVIAPSAVADYAGLIVDAWRRRQQMEILSRAIEAVSYAEDSDAALSEMESELLDVDEAQTQRASGITLGGALNEAIERMNAAYSGQTPPGISMGIPELERIVGKAQPGDYILIGARPSMGKSALAIDMARRMASAGTAVVYWCHEMAPADNAERLLTAETRARGVKVAYRDARAGRMSEAQFKALLEAGRAVEGLPIHFVESSIRDVTRVSHELRARARRYQRQGRDVVIVVDYLQQLTGAGKSRYEVVSETSAALKALAMEVRCPIIVLAQLSRSVEARDVKRPMMADLRDSGQIEQDANTVLLLYRDEYYIERQLQADPDGPDAPEISVLLDRARGKLEIIVAKQRSGPLETALVGFDGATNTIFSFGRRAEPADDQEGFKL